MRQHKDLSRLTVRNFKISQGTSCGAALRIIAYVEPSRFNTRRWEAHALHREFCVTPGKDTKQRTKSATVLAVDTIDPTHSLPLSGPWAT